GITSPQEDPDGDGMTNLVEYALGTDPNAASPERAPAVRLEQVNGQTRLVADFDFSADAIDSVVKVEAFRDLASSQWTPIQDGTGGAIVIRSGSKLAVSIPVDLGCHFLRLTISLKA
ncbi:thrombospondin type 3 repeat-containing protein, partial [Verrucomicrobiales bacterium]|nr:thrombospondin type 3 repeat-containing protein [Verrucomicrobiales bacterium]